MKRSGNKKRGKKTAELQDEAEMGERLPDRNTIDKEEIEQARIENRREADLDDKTPAGDSGPEDDNGQTGDPIGESNY